jgi:hypothetical protein
MKICRLVYYLTRQVMMDVRNMEEFLKWNPPFQEEIISNGILLPESRMVIHGKFKSWKCLHPDTYVVSSGQGLIKLGKAYNLRSRTLYTTSGPRCTIDFGKTVVDKALKITTSRGFEIVCSHEHKFLTLNDTYISADSMKVGYSLMLCYNSNIYGTKKVVAPYVLGLILGDGSLAQENYLGFTNQSKEMCKEVSTVFPGEIKNRGNHYQLNCYGYRDLMYSLWGIPNTSITSHTKIIPDCIMESPLSTQVLFLRGLIDTDGSITDRGVSIELSNQKLIIQLQLILSNMGIISNILHRPDHNSWKLYLGGSDAHKFRKLVYGEDSEYTSNDSPHELKKSRLKIKYSDGHFLYPDIISSIEQVDGGEFYDIEMSRPNNFIASGIVTHNSMLAMHTAFCIATGKPWFGFDVAKTAVMLVQIEISERAMHKRAVKYATNHQDNHSGLWIANEHFIKFDSSYGDNELHKDIQKYGIKVVIIDPLYKVMAGDTNKGADVMKLLDNFDNIIDKHHCSIIIVHHEHKMKYGDDGKVVYQGAEAMTGSQFIANWADSIVGINKISDDWANPVDLVLNFTALRNAENWPAPMGISIDRNNLRWSTSGILEKLPDYIREALDKDKPKDDEGDDSISNM